MVSIGRGGSQYAVVADQVKSRRGHESGQFLQQFLWGQQDLARTVRPGRFQGEGERCLVDEAQSAIGYGRPNHVATETLEPAPVGRLDTRRRMQ